MRIVDVYDPIIIEMLKKEKYPYTFHFDGEPYRFIGDDAVNKSIYWDKLLKTEIPVNLTVREAFLISRLLKDCEGYTELFGIEDCGEKLDQAVFDKTDKNR